MQRFSRIVNTETQTHSQREQADSSQLKTQYRFNAWQRHCTEILHLAPKGNIREKRRRRKINEDLLAAETIEAEMLRVQLIKLQTSGAELLLLEL